MLSPRQRQCLNGIGIRQWSLRTSHDPAQPEIQEIEAALEPTPVLLEKTLAETPSIVLKPVKLDSWPDITESIFRCEACELASSCTQKVPGVGAQNADLMIIGEGPGHEEDLKGEPFVGRSGQLLDKMLEAIGIKRSQAFITNIVKCRPPNNRDPNGNEVKACHDFIEAQIKIIEPKVILAVGRISAHHLLNTSSPVGKLIDQSHLLPGTSIPLKVTYHPAYLLRNPSAKAIVWRDMKNLHQMLNQ
jgi:uracil-DNA glycosylase family 4